MHTIEVIFTPALLPHYVIQGKTVVVIDILRASSSMCVAFKTGVKKILPVSTPEECRMFKDFDFIIAAERNAQMVDGFDLGNSPFEYENPVLEGKSIAFTTTNGTKAIKQAKAMQAGAIVIGSFLNQNYLCNWLLKQNNDIVLLCAGWKDKYNLEDALFAGAVIEEIGASFKIEDDSALAAHFLFQQHKNNIHDLVKQSSHAKRFTFLHLQTDDVSYCLQQNTCSVLPIMEDEYLVAITAIAPLLGSATGSAVH
ncbi:MAG: 2-phosphosulfolactate phosphatase [Bacteroidota bacterium]|nr:2-phosphosulfolactate phosphatase [Bacteroidota bacterium]